MKGKIYNSRNSKGIYTHETQRSPIFESTIVEILKVFTPGTVWASVDWASTIVEILKVFTPVINVLLPFDKSTIVEILKVFTPYHRKVIDF